MLNNLCGFLQSPPGHDRPSGSLEKAGTMTAPQHPMSIGMLQTGHEETVEVSEVIHPSRAVHHSACMQAKSSLQHVKILHRVGCAA